MKFGIAAKLGLLLALVGVMASGLTGFYAYEVSRDRLIQAAKNELLTSARVASRRLALTRADISRDLQTLAEHPAAQAALQDSNPAAQDQLATLFKLSMQVNPSYFQIRLISASDAGLERVRMDRDGDHIIRVQGDDRQEKSHYPYVYEALKMPPGTTYLSRIVINHEQGTHAGLGQPTVQLATPVSDAQGHALGVLVINVDLDGTFAQLAADFPPDFQLFMVNRHGDYLIHPDHSRAFGFDKGRRVLVQDEFPATQALLAGKVDTVILEAQEGQHANTPMVAAFISSRVKTPSEESRLILGLAQPFASVLKEADKLGVAILQIVGVFCLVCVLLAVLVARAVTRPINAMGLATQRFADGAPATGLPLERTDEIGALARSLGQMQNRITQQMAELKESRQELEHLARHDTLTGLPNRRLFQERLEHAVMRARRHREHFALLFIDMDNFKDINDQFGHHGGDAALIGVADRLLSVTRKVDTVARLGGDEFVVLLDSPVQREQVLTIAEQLLEGMQVPIPFVQHELRISFSIGISQYPEDGATANEMLASADRAMYQAKAAGRSGMHFSSQ